MIRLIATDLDGTLLDNRSEITPRTAAAVSRAMAAGAKFVVASGRMYQSTRLFAEQLDANAPILAFNGAMICDWRTGALLFARDIAVDTARAVCRMAETRDIFIQYFPERDFFYQKRRPELCDEYETRVRWRGQETGVALSRWIEKPAMKLLALGAPGALLELRRDILAAFPAVSAMLSHPTYLEIVASGVDKGHALARLAESLGVSPAEVAAFGDEGNDLSMLEYAGYGYAMENGSEQVLARVGRHAPGNDCDGVALVLEELLARGEIGG